MDEINGIERESYKSTNNLYQKTMKTKSLLLGAFALCFTLGLFTACGNSGNNKPETPKTPDKLDMTATPVKPDASGFIYLDQFLKTDPHLTVKVSDDFTTATIFYDGKEIQTIEDETGLVSDEATVRFLDANFDGQTDIYLGVGLSRTLNALFVWDDFEQQFQVVDGSSLQNPMLHPATKSFIDGGSSSYCETDITLNKWKKSMIMAHENLAIILDPEQYGELGVEHRYTLKDDNDKVLYSTDEVKELPEMWQTIVTTFCPPEE